MLLTDGLFMTLHSYFVLAVFIFTIIGLIKFQQRPSLVFGVALMTLFSTQMVTTDQVIKSLSVLLPLKKPVYYV